MSRLLREEEEIEEEKKETLLFLLLAWHAACSPLHRRLRSSKHSLLSLPQCTCAYSEKVSKDSTYPREDWYKGSEVG